MSRIEEVKAILTKKGLELDTEKNFKLEFGKGDELAQCCFQCKEIIYLWDPKVCQKWPLKKADVDFKLDYLILSYHPKCYDHENN